MKRFIRKTTQLLIVSVAILLVIFAVLLGIARIYSPYLTRYQPQLVAELSKAAQQPVTVKKMTITWRGIEPEIALHDVTLWNKSNTQPQLVIEELHIGINLFRSLVNWRWEPDSFLLYGAQLTIRQDKAGGVTINDFVLPAVASNTNSVAMDEVKKWLLARQRIRLQAIEINWYDKEGRLTPLTGVRLGLRNGITSSQLAGAATLAQAPGTHASFIIDFHGNILQPATLQATAYFHVHPLGLSRWLKNFFYAGLHIQNGTGDFEAQVDWNNGQLQKIRSVVAINNLVLQSAAPNVQSNTLKNLVAHLDWQKITNGWTLAGDQIQLQWNKNIWPESYFNLEWIRPAQNQPGNQIFQANFLDLVDISQFLLATDLLTPQQRKQLQTVQATGSLHNVDVQHTGMQLADNNVNGKMNLYQVGWKSWQQLPGITHLTGALQWNPQGGQLQLTSHQLQLDMPALFPQAVPLDQLAGQIFWQKTADGTWQLKTSNLLIEGAAFSFHPQQLQLAWPSGASLPNLDLTANFAVTDLQQALIYLPTKVMSKKLNAWFKQSLISGSASDGEMVLQGPLTQFPFDKGGGKFSVRALLHDAALNYSPGWPAIHHIEGAISFAGRALSIDADTAQILTSHLLQVKATISDLANSLLRVTGKIQGDMQDGLAFIRQSPLQETVGKNLRGIDLQGPMNLDLALTLPLDDNLGEDKVLGNLALQNTSLSLLSLGLQLTQLQGALQFTADGLSSQDIQGNLLGQPLTMRFVMLPATKKSPVMTQVNLKGKVNIRDLPKQFPSPGWAYVQGGILPYQATLLLSGTEKNTLPNTLTLVSDLKGLAINLPPPLGKNAEQTISTKFTASFADNQPLKLALSYDDRLSAAVAYRNMPQGYHFTGGEIHLGAGAANFQTLPGFLITGQLTALDLTEWQAFFTKISASATSKATSVTAGIKNWIRAIDVSFPQFTIAGQTLQHLKLAVNSIKTGWRVNIESDNVGGELLIPDSFSRGVLQGDFQYLYLQPGKGKAPDGITPAQIPALDIKIRDFHYDGNHYGQLTLQTTTQGNQLQIEELDLKSPVWHMNASGEWLAAQKGQAQKTSINGVLQSQDAGKMLSDLQVTQSLRGGKGDAAFTLKWPGTPFQFALGNLNGHIAVKVNNGRIINLKQSTQLEIGLGRILNLLSLSTIPQRLRLDFSDLTSSGLAFDILKGDLLLQNGDVTTTNTYLDGSVAKAALSGRIGLKARDYDVLLDVTPYITSSLPLVATIAGGPIVGAATWVVSKILSKEVNKFTTYHYRITGSWQEPNIVKLSAAGARLREAMK